MEPYFCPGPKRIAAALKLAGFPDVDPRYVGVDYGRVIETMVAIHGAETSGNVWAVSPLETNGTHGWGAFQVSAVTAPSNWASYFVNAQLAFPYYDTRGFQPWYGHAKIDQRMGLTKNPSWSYRTWARAGVSLMNAELKKGYSLQRIASTYLLEEGL